MKVYCTISILKKAWALLKEIGVSGMLSGEAVNINVVELMDRLLSNDKLNEFMQIITNNNKDYTDDDISEIGKGITDFFMLIGNSFAGLTFLKPGKKESQEAAQ
jgi:hypothetical protein